jgi:hypothetical protein
MKMSNLLVLLAALCLLGACKGSGKYEPVNNDTIAALSSADSVTETENKPLLVKTAEMRLKVKDIAATSEGVTSLTKAYSGMVMHHHMQSSAANSRDIKVSDDSVMRVSSFQTTADITVKIPSDSLQQYMNRVSRMGLYVNVRNLDIEDKTLDYLSSKMKLDSRTQIIRQQKKGKIVIKDPSAVLWLKDDMIDERINNSRINDAVKYSVVDLSLYQSNTIVKETMANDDPGAYQESFINRLIMAFTNGWSLFTDFIIALVNLWLFILAACAMWLGYKLYKRKTMPLAGTI